MDHKVKLFETVLGIHEKGAASLTASERELIEAETRDLLSAASRKQAMKAPEGFDSLLVQLKSSENADDAFEMVLNFLKDNEEGSPDKLDMVDDKKETMEELGDGPAGLEDKKEDVLEDKIEPPKPPMGMGVGMGMDKKPMDKLPMGDEKKDEKPDLLKEKKDLLARAAKLKAAEDDSEEEKEEKDEKKEDKKDDDKKEDKKEDKEEDKKEDKMGLKTPATAAKVKVKVTSSRNLLVSFDGKPLFHAIPNDAVKSNLNSLKRLANKVYGWVIYEGAKVAATKCGSRLIAGVDDDITPVFDEKLIPAGTDPMTSEGDDLIKDELDKPADIITEDAEFVTKETPSQVAAGLDDDIEVVTEEKPDSTPDSMLKDNETVHKEPLDAPEDDIRDEADTNYQHVEASYKELYNARAKKAVKKANQDFAAKFVRCMKIAAKRMLLNHDENPFKWATMEVLADENIFDISEEDAHEITEMIASLGQDDFVDLLLERTASLMKKSEEYVNDIEADLEDLSVKPVEVEREARVASTISNNEMRKAASEGNFSIDSKIMGTPVTRSSNTQHVGGVRGALGDTLLSRRSKSLQELSAQIER